MQRPSENENERWPVLYKREAACGFAVGLQNHKRLCERSGFPSGCAQLSVSSGDGLKVRKTASVVTINGAKIATSNQTSWPVPGCACLNCLIDHHISWNPIT